jgi:16S rRNA processing protein RimM
VGDLVKLGRILKPHGIAGAVGVLPFTSFPEDFLDIAPEQVVAHPPRQGRSEPLTLTIENMRVHKGRIIVTFREFASINDVERLRGWELMMSEEERPELEGDAFYTDQLIGLKVLEAESGECAGEVKEIIHGAAQDLIVVERPDGQRFPLPFVETIVGEIDLDAGTMTANIPEGVDDLGF